MQVKNLWLSHNFFTQKHIHVQYLEFYFLHLYAKKMLLSLICTFYKRQCSKFPITCSLHHDNYHCSFSLIFPSFSDLWWPELPTGWGLSSRPRDWTQHLSMPRCQWGSVRQRPRRHARGLQEPLRHGKVRSPGRYRNHTSGHAPVSSYPECGNSAA